MRIKNRFLCYGKGTCPFDAISPDVLLVITEK